MHGPGYPAFSHKLHTGPWQLFAGTSTHQSLPLDETAPNNRVSRSRKSQSFEIMYFQEICLSRPGHVFQKSTKNHPKKIVGLRPAPTPYGAAHLPPTKVGAKCLAALVLDNQDRALCPEINALSSKCNTNTDLYTIQLQINSVIHASGALRQRERPCIQTCASAI